MNPAPKSQTVNPHQPKEETISFLYSLQKFGIKLGLRNIRFLLDYLGNPEQVVPTVHIAGTNGKGSTSAMLAAILTASGYRTGLYTSPHLIDFNERIRINGKKISDAELKKYTKQLTKKIVETNSTFFEATTAIAFTHFAEQKVDVAVIETGLGGRFDATNVVSPLLSIITNIGLDHTEQLGSTLSEIAYEKGGIIKPGRVCITGETQPEPLNVLRKISLEKRSLLIEADNAAAATIIENHLSGLQLHLTTKQQRYKNIAVSLPGLHQAKNLRLAVLAAEALKNEKDFRRITSKTISAGLNNVQSLAGFHGRLEVVKEKPLTIFDVAHNPDGVNTAIASLQCVLVNKPLVVFGVMKDKEYASMISMLTGFARTVIAVQPETERALESASIVQHLHSYLFPVINGGCVENGLSLAAKTVRRDEAIVVLGSHYLIGEAMALIKGSSKN